RGTDVLLRAGIDETEARHVHRSRQDVRGHVGYQRHAAGLGNLVELQAVDGLVRGVVYVRGIAVEPPFAGRRQAGEAVVAGVHREIHLAETARVIDGPG